ncbi:MAG TPA: ABC transporter permease [Vicinamibacterales bacterium]|nr:ABC transporter permease [Vicinamibacterales bacterium]
MIDAVWRDARVAVRALGRQPGFTAIALLSLALGLGLNTAIFSLVNAVLLRPLPVDRPQELVAIFTSADSGDPYSSSSYPDYESLASGNSTLAGLAAHTLMFVGVDQGDATRMLLGEIVSPNYFSLLGVPLAAGRGFAAGDERPGASPSVVISSTMWRRDFNGDPGVVGRTLQIRGRPYTIVGIAPASFGGLASGVSAELWVPVGCVDDIEPVGMIDSTPSPGSNRIERRGQRWLFVTGRLKPDATIAQARANLGAMMTELARTFPQSNANRRLTVLPASSVRIHPELDAALTPGAAILMVAVGLVLLVACANLASLLLARAFGRSREMAIRLAVGASRGQLVRQLLIESLLLSLAGGAIGYVLAVWATRTLASVRPPVNVGVTFDLVPDARVFAFALGLGVATALLFGLIPALRASKPNLVSSLKGGLAGGPARRIDLRHLLVAGQVALSLVLIVAGGLFLRSAVAAQRADTGVESRRVVYATVNAVKMYADRSRVQQFYDDGARQIARIGGVTRIARATWVPLSLNHNTNVIEIAGVRGSAPDGGIDIDTTDVSAEYFGVLGVPLLAGRAFDARDTVQSEPVAIVSAAAARRYWPGRDAVGQQFRVRNGGLYTIVGVSRDYAVRAVGEAPRPLVHFAIDQTKPGYVTFVAETDRPAENFAGPVRRALVALDPRTIIVDLQPLDALVDAALFPVRAGATVLAGLSVLALVLATIGLYGVIAFNVSRQTREIGIRMALGAGQSRVVRRVVAEGLILVAAGGLVGAVAAGLAGRILTSTLYGVSAFDAPTWIAATLTLVVAAMGAAFVPARRAAAVDPMAALRQL